jgi:hypothetical protein
MCTAITVVVACLSALAQAAALAGPASAASVLAPGAEILDCRSALRPGPVQCDGTAEMVRDLAGANTPAAATPPAPEFERLVDRYLENYGKPPREAVRALLDPTDENIRALARKQEETLATVSYVAARMTRLQQEELPRGAEARWPDPDLPLFSRLRLTLSQRPDDASTQDALIALQSLARAAPSLQARVGLVGAISPHALREFLRRVPPALDVVQLPTEAESHDNLPQLRIDDLRSGQSLRLDPHEVDAARLRAWIVALRRPEPADRPVADRPEEFKP